MGVISTFPGVITYIKTIHANGSTGDLKFTYSQGAWSGTAFGDPLSDIQLDVESSWIGFVRNLGGGGTQNYQGTIFVGGGPYPLSLSSGSRNIVQLMGIFTEDLEQIKIPGSPWQRVDGDPASKILGGVYWWTTEAEPFD